MTGGNEMKKETHRNANVAAGSAEMKGDESPIPGTLSDFSLVKYFLYIPPYRPSEKKLPHKGFPRDWFLFWVVEGRDALHHLCRLVTGFLVRSLDSQ